MQIGCGYWFLNFGSVAAVPPLQSELVGARRQLEFIPNLGITRVVCVVISQMAGRICCVLWLFVGSALWIWSDQRLAGAESQPIQADQWSVATEVLFPPVFRAEYAAQARALLWLVRLRHTAARQRRIDYLDGWFRVVDRVVAAARGYFRHPAFWLHCGLAISHCIDYIVIGPNYFVLATTN